MKLSDMERSYFIPRRTWCVTALIAALVPELQAQDTVQTIERAPDNLFETARDNIVAKFLEMGPVSVRPHFSTDAYYDDNLTLQNGNEREDFVWRLSPGATLGMGEFRGDKGTYLSLDYTLRGSIYNKYDEYSSVDHFVFFSGGWKMSKLTIELGQSYEVENGKLIEGTPSLVSDTGGFVEQERYLTTLRASYELSEKTTLSANGHQSLISSDNIIPGPDIELNTVNEWVGELWGDYKVTEKVSTGVGAAFGWRDIHGHATTTPTPNQSFQQGLVRARYEPTEKLAAHGAIGFQFSQFQDTALGSGDDKGPLFIFNLGGSWRPLQRTTLSLEGYRRDVASYSLAGQTYTLTGFRGSVKQLLLDRFTAALYAGYENSDYDSVTSGTGTPDREDNYFWVRPAVDYEFDEHTTVGVFYQYRTKDADNYPIDYSNNQVGAYLSYRF